MSKTFNEYAQEIAEKHQGPDAIDQLVKVVTKAPDIWTNVLDQPKVLRRLCQCYLAGLRHDTRTQIIAYMSDDGDTPKMRADRARGRGRVTEGLRSTAWYWPIVGGKALCECNYQELMQSALARRKHANATVQLAQFEEGVAKLLGPRSKATVAEKLKPEDVQTIWNEVCQPERTGRMMAAE